MFTRVRPRTALVAASLLAGASLAATGTALANPGGTPAIPLNTEQETTGSDTGASGFFTYTISGTQLCYTLTARDLSASAVAAHIHHGPRNVAGPVVIPLTVAAGASFTHSACTTASPTLLASIQADPKAYYVNVHTPTFPGGEIRGQLK
jgi:Cu/Zn superoxide dismutase